MNAARACKLIGSIGLPGIPRVAFIASSPPGEPSMMPLGGSPPL